MLNQLVIGMLKAFTHINYLIAGIFFLFSSIPPTQADEWEKILNLEGKWRFSIGDALAWANPSFDDKNWDIIQVPSSWENQGFYGYDGYAWYRKTFKVPAGYQKKDLYLSLGYVDDVDEVYINGQIIGFSGTFPPRFKTAFRAYRMYPIPAAYLNMEGENVIAVRVYDSVIEGGITEGEIGIYINHADVTLSVDLRGIWNFKTGDSLDWQRNNLDDTDWNKIMVPAKWEHQGFWEYNGYAWYRKTVVLPKNLKGEKLFLVLGYIDDYNEVFVNGALIGSTGMTANGNPILGDDEAWLKPRIYYLPADVIHFGKNNTIAVRIFDKIGDGGIYNGPVGIIRQSQYESFRRRYND